MRNTTIVVIEDDKVLSDIMAEGLREEGFEVRQAFDGNTAMQFIQEKQPALIMLDLILPKKDGFEILTALKESPATKNIPIVVLTMLSGDRDAQKATELGADAYIVKSEYAAKEVVAKIKSMVKK